MDASDITLVRRTLKTGSNRIRRIRPRTLRAGDPVGQRCTVVVLDHDHERIKILPVRPCASLQAADCRQGRNHGPWRDRAGVCGWGMGGIMCSSRRVLVLPDGREACAPSRRLRIDLVRDQPFREIRLRLTAGLMQPGVAEQRGGRGPSCAVLVHARVHELLELG